MTDIYVYNLVAYRNGVKETLCTYRGGDNDLYNFQIERVKGKTLGDCCGDSCGGCAEDECSCT